jgi:hypothetical protein
MRTSLDKFDPRKGFDRGLPSSVDALSEALRRIADPLNVAYGPSPAIRPTVQRSTVSAAAMGRRSREIVAKFGCENFAQQAMRAAEAAQQA